MTTNIDGYFIDETRAILDDFFWNLGAQLELSRNRNAVRYSTDDWFAEVICLATDGPNYSPRIEIGCYPEQYADPRRNRVDVMHTTPVNSEEHNYNLSWRYRTREEYRSALTAVRDRILAVYSLSYLMNPSQLRTLLEERRDVVDTEWTNEINEHNDSINRRLAEVAFKNRDYAKAIECYSNIPRERHTSMGIKKGTFYF